MVLDKLPVPGRPTNLDNSREGPTVLAVSSGGVVWTFFLSSINYVFFISLSERWLDIS